jgi:sugar phosphate permease
MVRRFQVPFFYGWIVVALTFASTLVATGIRSAPQVFILPLEGEFGWTRTGVASAVSLNLMLYGMAGPVSGYMIDRFGPRLVMMGSLTLLGLGLAGTFTMSSIWQLYLFWGVVVGLGAGGTASVMYASVASRWFVARRGLVIGLLSSASATGQLIFLPFLTSIVLALGWRSGSLILAAIAIGMIVPLFLFMRNDPADVGQRPYGADSAEARKAAAAEGPTLSLREVARRPEFWLIAGAMFTCGGTANGLIGTHLMPHSIEHGIAPVMAATTVSVMGAMNFIGTMLAGWLADRFEPRKMLAVIFGLRGLSLFMLPFLTDFPGLWIFATIYGLDWFATVPPVIALITRNFGRRAVGTVYGFVFMAHQLGAGVSSTGGGLIHDWLGDYQVAFLAGGFIALCGALMSSQVREPRVAASAAAAA